MKKAFTLMELLVVVLILGLLATIAVGVFTAQVERARYAAARTTIAALDLAAKRYQLDLGQFPPSGSNLAAPNQFEGNGWLYLVLTRSASGTTTAPASNRWQGPYIDVNKLNIGDIEGHPIDDIDLTVDPLLLGQIQILDPWGSPYRYVRCCGSVDDNYDVNQATVLPPGNPYALTEQYYNPATFQISSKGMDGMTSDSVTGGFGTHRDDVNNFGF